MQTSPWLLPLCQFCQRHKVTASPCIMQQISFGAGTLVLPEANTDTVTDQWNILIVHVNKEAAVPRPSVQQNPLGMDSVRSHVHPTEVAYLPTAGLQVCSLHHITIYLQLSRFFFPFHLYVNLAFCFGFMLVGYCSFTVEKKRKEKKDIQSFVLNNCVRIKLSQLISASTSAWMLKDVCPSFTLSGFAGRITSIPTSGKWDCCTNWEAAPRCTTRGSVRGLIITSALLPNTYSMRGWGQNPEAWNLFFPIHIATEDAGIVNMRVGD